MQAMSEDKIIEKQKLLMSIDAILNLMPEDWLKLTTHRLDIYEEDKAKFQFIAELEKLISNQNLTKKSLEQLPTAYDYIRLGHPLSSLLEWAIAKLNSLSHEDVISFSSKTAPILAVLRTNQLLKKLTRIVYKGKLPFVFDKSTIERVYGFSFEIIEIDSIEAIEPFNGSTIFIHSPEKINDFKLHEQFDFVLNVYPEIGSILCVNCQEKLQYIAAIQHFRRRETIAMTPFNSNYALEELVDKTHSEPLPEATEIQKSEVEKIVQSITLSDSKVVFASSGLSMQYAIAMGLIDEAKTKYPTKPIRFIVPPNCYGGTNDQARRVADSSHDVKVLDLPVDGENDMVSSLEEVLNSVALEDGVPYIIVEIPTNPRVEVPDLEALKITLEKSRLTKSGNKAIEPVFILDQTFCPNVHFLSEDNILSGVKTIAYVSGSKFPSGGLCTAGYATSNSKAQSLMTKIDLHLNICDNQATSLQYNLLAKQLPSMNERIYKAYINTKDFVSYIKQVLPDAKINFVSKELADQGFTPSVFSLDLPTKGQTEYDREKYKRTLNLQLINKMIKDIANESKFCVSYGQLKGCYWTIPATSTQGTTKEGDKDYIVRVALSPEMDLEKHKSVFLNFVESL